MLTSKSRYIEKKKTDFFETIKHSKNYFFANVAVVGLSFISIPIFTRLFTTSDFGTYSVFVAYLDIFTILIALNAYSAPYRYYYEQSRDFTNFMGSTLIFIGAIFFLNIFIYSMCFKRITHILELPSLVFIYLLIACLFNILYILYRQILIVRKRSRESAIIRVSKEYATFGLSILFVCFLRYDRYLGRVWGILLVGLIFSVYFIIKLLKISRFSLKWNHIKYIAFFSFPLIPYNLSGIILAQFDKVMVNDIVSTAAAGLYSFGYAVGMFLNLVIASIHLALVPVFFRLLNENKHSRLDDLIRKMFAIVTFIAMVLLLFSKEIVVLLADKKFYPGLDVIPVVVMGYVFFGLFVFYNNYMTYSKKTGYISATVLISGISSVILNAIFIPRYGFIAAAYTTLFSFFCMFLLTWIVLKYIVKQRVAPLWAVGKPILIMLVFLSFSAVLKTIQLNHIIAFVIKLVELMFFGIIIFHRDIREILTPKFV